MLERLSNTLARLPQAPPRTPDWNRARPCASEQWGGALSGGWPYATGTTRGIPRSRSRQAGTPSEHSHTASHDSNLAYAQAARTDIGENVVLDIQRTIANGLDEASCPSFSLFDSALTDLLDTLPVALCALSARPVAGFSTTTSLYFCY